jgi:hypothetical protein
MASRIPRPLTFNKVMEGVKGGDGNIYRACFLDKGYGDKAAIQKKVPGVRGWTTVAYNLSGGLRENLLRFLSSL